MRVLIVEDDEMLRAILGRALRADGFLVDEAGSLAEGQAKSAGGPFQLLLVDWNLPDGNGTDLVRAYRAGGGSGATIVITARNSIEDQVLGLDAGADDFLVKPFHIPPLRARVRALMRRSPLWTPQLFIVGDLTIDGDRRTALANGRPLDLTAKEWQALRFLAQSEGHPAARADVQGELWSEATGLTTHTLEVHISNIRRKLEAAGSTVRIVARRGAGYQLIPAPH